MLSGLVRSCKTSSEKNPGFTLNGTINGYQDSIIFLKKRAEGKWGTIDSTKVTDGKFTLKGNTNQSEMGYLFGDKCRVENQIMLNYMPIIKIKDLKF